MEHTNGRGIEYMFTSKEWDTHPEELKAKIISTNRAFKRVSKATKQHTLWRVEMDLAQKELEAARDTMNECLNRWNPETNTLTALEDAPERKAC